LSIVHTRINITPLDEIRWKLVQLGSMRQNQPFNDPQEKAVSQREIFRLPTRATSHSWAFENNSISDSNLQTKLALGTNGYTALVCYEHLANGTALILLDGAIAVIVK
jgi:hypothetical protein